jgi:hypothetical protein
MKHGSAEARVRRCCYVEQATAIESAFPAGAVVVDVGQTRRENESRVARALPSSGASSSRGGAHFHAPALTPIPPVFACPALRIPRFLFPFPAQLYHWTM